VYEADLDGDGDLDRLSASQLNGKIVWQENIDGAGGFGLPQVIGAAPPGAELVYAADLDRDGDLDVLSFSDANNDVFWYENLGTRPVGDANRDGEFDQRDIVQVLQAAKYMTGEPAAWGEGDWNGDGQFNQLDLILALQGATYVAMEALYPDVLAVTLTETGDNTYRVSVTLSSPYDTRSRYADAWRVLAPDGTVLGVRVLTHDHQNEQPFTRSLSGVIIPLDVTRVTVEGRDQISGWGGMTVTVSVSR
jgi:hypothetical protein